MLKIIFLILLLVLVLIILDKGLKRLKPVGELVIVDIQPEEDSIYQPERFTYLQSYSDMDDYINRRWVVVKVENVKKGYIV